MKKNKLPANMTEDEVMVVINNVANRLARRFKFGYHDVDDMRQQARMYAWEGLDGYDGIRPLENFLWTHVRNRLFNFKRDKYERPSKPCLDCPYTNLAECEKYGDHYECESYRHWLTRNQSKKNLMSPIDIEEVNDDNEQNMHTIFSASDSLHFKEMMAILEKNIPANLRQLFLRLKNGNKLTKVQKIKIITIIREILDENGYGKY